MPSQDRDECRREGKTHVLEKIPRGELVFPLDMNIFLSVGREGCQNIPLVLFVVVLVYILLHPVMSGCMYFSRSQLGQRNQHCDSQATAISLLSA